MSALEVRGAPLPERGGQPTYPVIWPRFGEVLEITILDKTWTGYRVHWVQTGADSKGRTLLCLSSGPGCPYCPDLVTKWVGMIPCIHHNRAELAILAMFPELARQIEPHHSSHFGLRGVRVRIEKTAAYKSAPCLVSLSDLSAPAHLVKPHSMEATLKKVWGLSDYPMNLVIPQVAEEGEQ